jgi:uridine kinase
VRSTVVEALADVVTGLRLGHPTRVGIDGRSAAGKTTLANELAATIKLRGREVLRAELDDFHRPGHKFRSVRGEWTPHSYYAETYDYVAVRQVLLEPLGSGGNRRCRTRLFDSYHDAWLPEEWHVPPADAVVLVDGGFLLRPELAALWDYVVWLDVDMDTMIERARRRDVAWVGSEDVSSSATGSA